MPASVGFKDRLLNTLRDLKFKIKFSNKELEKHFDMARQEEIFTQHLASADLSKMQGPLNQMKSTFDKWSENKTQVLANIFPEKEPIPGQKKTFHETLKSQPTDSEELKQAKNVLNDSLKKIYTDNKDSAVVTIKNSAGDQVDISMNNFMKNEIDRLTKGIEKVESNPIPSEVPTFLRHDFLGGVRSSLENIKNDAMEALRTQQKKEKDSFDGQFNTEEFKTNLKQVFNITEPNIPDGLVNSLKSAFEKNQQNELKEFEKTFNNQRTDVERKMKEEMYRLSMIMYLKEHGHPDIKEKLAQSNDTQVSQAHHSNGSYKETKYDKELQLFKPIPGVEIKYDIDSGTFSANLPSNPERMKSAMQELVKNVYASGRSDEITLKLDMDKPQHSEQAAQELYLVCIQNGYPPDKIHITANGKDVTEKNKEGKMLLVANTPAFEGRINQCLKEYSKTEQSRTQSPNSKEDENSKYDRHTAPQPVPPH